MKSWGSYLLGHEYTKVSNENYISQSIYLYFLNIYIYIIYEVFFSFHELEASIFPLNEMKSPPELIQMDSAIKTRKSVPSDSYRKL